MYHLLDGAWTFSPGFPSRARKESLSFDWLTQSDWSKFSHYMVIVDNIWSCCGNINARQIPNVFVNIRLERVYYRAKRNVNISNIRKLLKPKLSVYSKSVSTAFWFSEFEKCGICVVVVRGYFEHNCFNHLISKHVVNLVNWISFLFTMILDPNKIIPEN